MELFQAKDDYILQSGDRALWCSRKDGTMTVRPGTYRMTSLPASAVASHLSGILTFATVRGWLEMVLVYLSTLCCVDTVSPYETHPAPNPGVPFLRKALPVFSIVPSKCSVGLNKHGCTNEVAYFI